LPLRPALLGKTETQNRGVADHGQNLVYKHGSKSMQYKWVVLTVTGVGMLMAGINMRVVTIGLPTIATALSADLETILWVTQAYQFMVTIALLVVGRLTDMFGKVRIYNLGFAIFTVGAVCCSFSQSGEQLIVSRLIQGLGSAMLVANSVALITDATPLAQLGFAISINQIVFRAGSVIGLTLGGALIQLAGWRSVFYMNIPVGIFGTLWAYVRLKEVGRPSPHEKFDLGGFITFTVALTALLLAATLGTMDPGYIPLTAALATVSVISFVLFILQERRTVHPILDLRMFSNRIFAAGNASVLLMALAMGALTLIASIYLQVIQGYGALETGLVFIPMEIAFVTIGPISGSLSDRYGPRALTTAGLGTLAISLFMISGIPANVSPWNIAIILALAGVGLGLFSAPNMSTMMRTAPPERRGVASAIRSTIFNSGIVISISLVAAILVTEMPYATASGMISGQLGTVTVAEQISFLDGIRKAFLISGFLSLIGMIPSALENPKDQSHANA